MYFLQFSFNAKFYRLSHESKNRRHNEQFFEISGWHLFVYLLQMPENRDENNRLITWRIHFFFISLHSVISPHQSK